ncbi:MAG: hypothetical protein ABEJ99_00410, partial [Candidatus Nanohaloarchaea archaeon]
IQGFEIFSRASRELEEQEVADRQADELARKLKNSHISVPVEKNVEYEKTASPRVFSRFESSLRELDRGLRRTR